METAAPAIRIDTSPRTEDPRPTATSSRRGLPEPAARFLAHAIGVGAALPERVCLTMHGQIKVMGVWLPFRAEETIDRRSGFTWHATVAGGLLRACDAYDLELGRTNIAVGRVHIASAEGPDVTRSALGRFLAEQAVWLPGSLLPDAGTHWSPDGRDHAVAMVPGAGTYARLHLGVKADGAVRDLTMLRWGRTHRRYDWIPFGMRADAETTFGGLTVVSQGSVGWWYGTDKWPYGEFFRFTIDDLCPF